MEEEKKKKILISAKAFYQYCSSAPDKISEGNASIVINSEEIIISQQFKDPYVIKLVDIIEINAADYKVRMPLSPAGSLLVGELGYEYDNFIRLLTDARNEILAKYLLMEEKIIRKDIKSEFSYLAPGSSPAEKGNCNITIYETGISILPENGKVLRIAYCEILDVEEGDYRITISSESGQKLELSKMGYEFDSFKKTLADTINALDMFAQNLVTELDPGIDTVSARKAARLLRDGKAAMKKDIEKYSIQAWKSLEKKIEEAGIAPEYNYLKTLSCRDQAAIGLKQGLMGSMTSDYIWFLMPVYSNDPAKPGNAIVMEAVPIENVTGGGEAAKSGTDNQAGPAVIGKTESTGQFKIQAEAGGEKSVQEGEDNEKTGWKDEPGGKATYLFKILNRADYSKAENLAGLGNEVEKLMKKINKAMISINFRREPIYIEDEKLYYPENFKYRFAISKIEELREIREKFIGRAMHLNFDSWKASIDNLLAFNVSTADEKARLKK